MRRRALLTRGGAILVAAVGGCLRGTDPSGGRDETEDPSSETPPRTTTRPSGGTTTPSETSTQVTPDPDDPIQIVVSNDGERSRTVTLTVTSAGGTVREATVEVDPDTVRTVDTGITTTGDYELHVVTADGVEESVPFDIEDYDIRMGSNLMVSVADDGIMVAIEE